MIHSEFQAMGSEIDRIAAATDFNGVKLLNGSLNGRHDGSGLEAKGELKIHFGTGNDSAEDYYYVNIGDCSTKGLGLRESEDTTTAVISRPGELAGELKYEYVIAYPPYSELNDQKAFTSTRHGTAPFDVTTLDQGKWYCGVDEKSGNGSQNTLLLIKAGTKNFVLNEIGSSYGTPADNDIQLFTLDGKHLAGRSPIPDYNSFDHADKSQPTNLATISERIGFDENQYDNSYLNKGVISQDDGYTMNFTSYNGMTIGYSGDGAEEYDNVSRYEVLFIDEAKEDLVVWMPGVAGAVFKYYLGEAATGAPLPPSGDSMQVQTEPGAMLGIETQEKAQQALERIDDAVARKDTERAHLGALQNRFENTVANIAIQYQSIQSAESRISDADIAREMTEFVRGQVLAQSATAILAQANSSPNMLLALLQR